MAQFGHLVSGAAWAISGKVIQFLLSLVTLAVIARLVGPEAYGIYALGWLALGLFDILVGGAPTDTLVQRKVATAGHFNATFWATLLIALLGWFAIWQGAETVSGWLNGGVVLAAILPVRALVFVLRAVGVGPGALLMRTSRFRAVAKAEMVASVVSNLVGLGMAVAGAGIWSLVWMELTRALIVTVAAFILTGWRPGITMRWRDLADLAAFNVSTWGSWGLGYVQSQMPRLLIGSVLGPNAVGFYALAQRLCDQVSDILMVPAYNVVQAGIARAQDDLANAKRLAAGTLRVTAVLACPLFLGLAALAPILVPAVFGAAWTDAIPVVQLLMLVGIRSSLSTIQAAVIRGMGKPHWEMAGAMVGVLLAAAMISLAVPHGLVAATVAFVLSGFVVFPLEALFVTRLIRLTLLEQTGDMFRAGAAGAMMVAAILAVTPSLAAQIPPVLTMAVLMPFGAVVYWAMLRVFMPAAAAVIGHVVLAVARRDFGAVRASLGGLSA